MDVELGIKRKVLPDGLKVTMNNVAESGREGKVNTWKNSLTTMSSDIN